MHDGCGRSFAFSRDVDIKAANLMVEAQRHVLNGKCSQGLENGRATGSLAVLPSSGGDGSTEAHLSAGHFM